MDCRRINLLGICGIGDYRVAGKGREEKTSEELKLEQTKQLGEVVSAIVKNAGPFFHKIIDLAKTNPLWGGVLGIIIIDVLSHKVNWLKWEHQDLICVDDMGKPITGIQAALGCLTHTKNWVWVPGILSQGALAQVSGLILSSFAIASAGSIIADFTQITKLVGGGTPDPAALVKPSVLTLVEQGVPITVPGTNLYTQTGTT